MSQELEIIGARINHARQKRHLSQASLAELLKVSTAHISDIERGQTNCSITILKSISEVLDVSADWLLLLNTESARTQSFADLAEILNDCTQVECEVLLTTLRHLKTSLLKLRENDN